MMAVTSSQDCYPIPPVAARISVYQSQPFRQLD